MMAKLGRAAETLTLTGMERETRRALAVVDRVLPARQPGADLRAALLPVLLAELLTFDYDSDGPYAGLNPEP